MGIHLILVTLSSLANPLITTYPLTLPLALLAHLMTQDLRNQLHRDYTQKLIEHLTLRHGRQKRVHLTTNKPLLTRTPTKRKNQNLNTPNTNNRPQGNLNPQRAPPRPPDPGPQPHGAQQNPSGSNNNQKEKRKKRSISQDKKNAKLTQNKKTKTLYSSPHTSTFNCLSINIQGLSHQKWNAVLGSVTVHNTAIVLTEHHLPFFDHTPSYIADSGWELHTIMGPPKTNKAGNDTQASRGGVAIAIRKNSFTVKTKIHETSEMIQAATWSLTEGRLLPSIHVTGIYISPSP